MPSTGCNIVFVIIGLLGIIADHRDFGCGANMQVHYQSTPNDNLSNEMFSEKIDQLKLPKDQTLVVRLPSNTLLKYTSYKDVSILHFRIPTDTRTAFFMFKAYEESKSAFQRKCKPRDVTLHLKAGSYPVISPENITFPRNFLNSDQRFRIYDLQFQSDEEQQRITVHGPQLGNWFAVAFVSWTDPNNDRIEQQGLAASCDTLLLAEMSVSRFYPIIINNGQVHNGTLTSRSHEPQHTSKAHSSIHRDSKQNSSDSVSPTSHPDSESTVAAGIPTSSFATSSSTPLSPPSASLTDVNSILSSKQPPTHIPTQSSSNGENNNNGNTWNKGSFTNNEIIYKFYVPRNVGSATARITITSACLHCPDVGFHVQSNAFPHTAAEAEHGDESNYAHSAIIKPNQTGEVSIEFHVQPNSWHYVRLEFVNATDEMSTASARLTLSELKLLNKLKKVSEGSALRRDNGAAHATHNPHDAQGQHQPRLRRQNIVNPLANHSGKGSFQHNLQYTLRIDFQEPIDEEGETRPFETAPPLPSPEPPVSPSTNASASNTTTKDALNPWKPYRFRDMEFYPLLRQTYREFFMFDYDLVPDTNGTVPTVLNLTAGTPAGFAFEIGEVYDIGGTLSFAVSMKHGLKMSSELKSMPTASQSSTERSGILAEKLVAQPVDDAKDTSAGDDDKDLPRSNQTIIVCMHLGEPGEPTWPDKCRYGQKLLPASSIVNNTDSNTSTGLVHVPFPESGQWYVTMGLYCHGAETAARVTIIDSVKEFVKKHANMLDDMRPPCACAAGAARYVACVNDRKCLATMNETETLKVKECLMDSKCTSNYLEMTRQFERHHKFATEQHFALDNCNTSVVFTISSSPCVAGRCGRFGRCYHYMSGGFVFSTCVCMKGYRGWDCTEDSQVPSSISILMASLLLTLSNLLFFPSIYMAMRRKYYTEAVIYFFAMFFSIFYHACDSGEDEYSFCLVKIGVLQFCDFYCGLLAIWVTLVAMAHIRQQFVSLLHMFGAILLAFGTELNKQSLWVFLAPALTGICIISTSWGLRCYKTRKWFPARKYLTVYMPLGTVLVMVGLICYAFLQTKQNYHIVHSIWHMVMALSILCLLPSRKSFMPKC